MSIINDDALKNVSGGADNNSNPVKKFKCLGAGCEGIVTATSINGVDYEGTCPSCLKLWDFNVNEAIG